MHISHNTHAADPWSDWVLERRHAGNPARAAAVRADILGYVDRLLDLAGLDGVATMVDVGSGEGLLALRALERGAAGLQAWLTDVSPALLAHARAAAQAAGVASRCSFVEAEATRMDALPEAGFDLVATRAALAYVADKPAALAEFARLLRPGGRLALAEPVFQDEAYEARALRAVAEAGNATGFIALLQRWKSAQFPDTAEAMAASPLCNFNERDLLRMVQQAGFVDLHLEFHIDLRAMGPRDWDDVVGASPHPWAPTLGEVMATHIDAAGRALLEQVVRPKVESGAWLESQRVVYLVARRA